MLAREKKKSAGIFFLESKTEGSFGVDLLKKRVSKSGLLPLTSTRDF